MHAAVRHRKVLGFGNWWKILKKFNFPQYCVDFNLNV
jgi:hypothetical protein